MLVYIILFRTAFIMNSKVASSALFQCKLYFISSTVSKIRWASTMALFYTWGAFNHSIKSILMTSSGFSHSWGLENSVPCAFSLTIRLSQFKQHSYTSFSNFGKLLVLYTSHSINYWAHPGIIDSMTMLDKNCEWICLWLDHQHRHKWHLKKFSSCVNGIELSFWRNNAKCLRREQYLSLETIWATTNICSHITQGTLCVKSQNARRAMM